MPERFFILFLFLYLFVEAAAFAGLFIRKKKNYILKKTYVYGACKVYLN